MKKIIVLVLYLILIMMIADIIASLKNNTYTREDNTSVQELYKRIEKDKRSKILSGEFINNAC